MQEIWKDIKGYEGYYQASNLGRIRRKESYVDRNSSYRKHKLKINGKILSPYNHESGYLRINLSKNGKSKSRYVHNIIMETFVGVKPKKHDVDHIDKCRTNNNLSNLRYLTYKLNRGAKNNKYALNKGTKVRQYTLDYKFIKEYITAIEASRITNTNYSSIFSCLSGRIKKANNFIWKRV